MMCFPRACAVLGRGRKQLAVLLWLSEGPKQRNSEKADLTKLVDKPDSLTCIQNSGWPEGIGEVCQHPQLW